MYTCLPKYIHTHTHTHTRTCTRTHTCTHTHKHTHTCTRTHTCTHTRTHTHTHTHTHTQTHTHMHTYNERLLHGSLASKPQVGIRRVNAHSHPLPLHMTEHLHTYTHTQVSHALEIWLLVSLIQYNNSCLAIGLNEKLPILMFMNENRVGESWTLITK